MKTLFFTLIFSLFISTSHVIAADNVLPGLDSAAQNIDGKQAVRNYNDLLNKLNDRKMLIPHADENFYLPSIPMLSYTVSSIKGMGAVRTMLPADKNEQKSFYANMGIILEWNPHVLFMRDGSGFFVRKNRFGKNEDDWAFFDTNLDKYLYGHDAQPYVQKMLTSMDTTGLPKVGTGKPAFIFFTCITCPYSAKVDPVLAKANLNYRVFPTFTTNPRVELPYVHKIFCSKDPLATFRKYVATRPLPEIEYEECKSDSMPNYAMADIRFIQGVSGTPSYYFPDGTVITGADKIEQVKLKSKEMIDKGLFFK